MSSLETIKVWIIQTVFPQFIARVNDCKSLSVLQALTEETLELVQLNLRPSLEAKQHNKKAEKSLIDAILIKCATFEEAIQASLTHIQYFTKMWQQRLAKFVPLSQKNTSSQLETHNLGSSFGSRACIEGSETIKNNSQSNSKMQTHRVTSKKESTTELFGQ